MIKNVNLVNRKKSRYYKKLSRNYDILTCSFTCLKNDRFDNKVLNIHKII